MNKLTLSNQPKNMKTIYKGGVVRIESQGPAEVLQYAIQEVQEPRGHEILISQKAIAINFVDIMYRNGTFPISSFPATIGGEAAGIVENVGSEVTAFKEGDRVAYYNALGSYAEQRLVRTEDLVKLPDDISYDQAASILAKGLTARMLIRQIYPVKPGDIILVHAAAGGVGSLLSKWAKALGATVIGTVGTEAKRAIASDNGVDHVIVMETQDLEAKVKELIGNQRIDAVFDGVGKATFNISLRLLKNGGTAVLFGMASGNPHLDMNYLSKRQIRLVRPALQQYLPDMHSRELATRELFDAWRDGSLGTITPTIYALKDAAVAHRDLEEGKTTGSIILHP